MNVQRSSPISISLPERTRHDTISRVKSSLDFHRTRTNSISPGLASPTPPTFIPDGSHRVSHIGKYLLVEHIEGHNTGNVFRAVDYNTEEEFICKVYKRADYMKVVDGYFRVAPHPHINSVVDVVVGPTNAYLFFLPGFHAENLHSYVRSKQRLQEVAAAPLFKQVVSAVAHVHKNNIVLRDLKLRKFIFRDMERTELMLESLEEACVLEDDDDNMTDRHGCPAYASPEILSCSAGYSGKASDVWSLGVMLYTLLVGRYPFHESDPRALFVKISRGHFSLPDTLSSEARNLIRSLLKKNPSERLSSQEILDHPWLKRLDSLPLSLYSTPYYDDQMVPDVATTSTSEEEHDEIFT
uniref:Tribbles homolog 2 n=1 Tax=Ciona intestinalis TaxID=7719 RepID=F7B5N7_CIOIN